jgi:hypothetical protein
MARRTDLELLIDMLKSQPGHQASAARLSGLLGWGAEKVKRVAARGNDDPAVPVFVASGGAIKHRGSERGASVGLYGDVARIIKQYWGERVLGLRNLDVIVTAHSGHRGSGVWTHPDLIVAADPPRRRSADEPRRLHALEVETADGFDLRSVYQAHAQGRGAHYSWVFGSKAPGVDPIDWERVTWTAESLGIGLVTFEKPHAYGTWTTHLKAELQEPSAIERERFIVQTVSAGDRALIGL